MHPDILHKCEAIAALCREYSVARLEVFGSAARGSDFDPARSDADFLVTFTPAARYDFAAFADFQEAWRRCSIGASISSNAKPLKPAAITSADDGY